MKVRPLAAIGAEIEGVDLREVDDPLFERIHRAWLDHAVLRFRAQQLDDESLQGFSQRFGPLESAPMGLLPESVRARIPNPFIATISNIVIDGRPIGGLAAAEAAWHTDMSYIEHPPTASVLHAIEVPASGGDTHYTSMYHAFEALPDALCERVRGLSLKHDAAHDSIGGLRPGFDHASSPVEAPGCVHPIVRIHPETGREVLFLGRRQDAYVPGLELAESEALVDELWEYVALQDHCWTQQWQPGDLVIWDNRCVMHRRGAFDPQSRRLMRRTQIRPVSVA